jgi:hypothetical protein
VYCYMDDLSHWLRRLWGAEPDPTATAG